MISDDYTRRPDRAVALIALLSLPLFVYGLGSTYLWQDEAQTALLARSVLRHGVPMVGSGADSLSAVMGADAGINGMYFQISWLQAYLAALSFRLLGESSWSARLPFAIAGWLCVPLTAWVVRRAGSSRTAARMAALLVATSVPFIVCARQARYYALAALFVLVATGTYAAMLERARERRPLSPASAAFAVAATLLVLSFDVTALGILAMVALHWLVFAPRSSRPALPFWAAWGTAAFVLAVWIGSSLSAPVRQTNAGISAVPVRIWYGSLYYMGQIDAHVVPLPVAISAIALSIFSQMRTPTILVAAIMLGGFGGGMLSPYRFFRYVLPVVPLIFALVALGLGALSARGRWGAFAAGVIVLVLVTSSAPHSLSHVLMASLAKATGFVTVRERSIPITVPLAQLLHELRDPPRGPIAAVVEYLRENAAAGDVLVTTYEELPLKFHTELRVFGGETAQLPPEGVRTKWIWPRQALGIYPAVRPATEWVQRELSGSTYRKIELEVVDRRWENREDPEAHIFSNPGPPGPRVLLYKAAE